MVVVPLSKPGNAPDAASRARGASSVNWVPVAAATALAAGSALILSGKRRVGMVTAASGTALAMLDQQETVRAWWNALPGYLAEAQGWLTRVQAALDDVSDQRERLRRIMAK